MNLEFRGSLGCVCVGGGGGVRTLCTPWLRAWGVSLGESMKPEVPDTRWGGCRRGVPSRSKTFDNFIC